MTLRTALILVLATAFGLFGSLGVLGGRVAIPGGDGVEYHLHAHSHGGPAHVHGHRHSEREVPVAGSERHPSEASGGASWDDHHCCCDSGHRHELPCVVVLPVRPEVRSHFGAAVCSVRDELRPATRFPAEPRPLAGAPCAGAFDHLRALRTVVLLT